MKTVPQLLLVSLVSTVLLSACGQRQETVATHTATSTDKESALDTLRKAASAGNAKAQLELARRFDKGDGVNKNLTTAFAWYQKAAEGGNADAMLAVADCLGDGKGVEQNTEKVKPWLKKAAEAGNPEAQYRIANSFGQTWRSTFILGDKNDKKGQQENAKKYLEWLDKAAKQNYLPAQYAIGMTYFRGAVSVTEFFNSLHGRGDFKGKYIIDPDAEKALPMLKQSADAGYWKSQWALAVLYQTGFQKIKSDKELSKKYWKLLEDQSDPSVQYSIGLMYHFSRIETENYFSENMYLGRELTRDEANEVAMEWFQKASDKNDKDALYALGKMYRDDMGIYNDNQKAMKLFRRAAKLGNYDAMQDLAFGYISGNGVTKDYAEAHKWLLKAANERPQSIALIPWQLSKVRNALGASYEYGLGVKKDLVLAYVWYNIGTLDSSIDKEWMNLARKNLARVERSLTPGELSEAQTLSHEWQQGKQIVRADTSSAGPSAEGASTPAGISLKLTSIGTGFYISPNGNVITNNHVIRNCKEIRIPAEGVVAKLVVADQVNDLALVKLDVVGKQSLSFPDTNALKQGEDIFVFGFPLDGYLPSTGNITPGVISALAGPGNNSSLLQITAPIQQGNSGGPVLNKKGQVVGVVVGKVDAIKVAKITGDIPQNLNFAIAARTVKSFLDGNRIDYKKSGNIFTFDKDAVGIADEARKASLKIECWR